MRRVIAVLLLALVAAGIASLTANASRPSAGTPTHIAAQPNQASGPVVGRADRADVSPPLREMHLLRPAYRNPRDEPLAKLPQRGKAGASRDLPDTALQKFAGPLLIPTPSQNFDGMINYWGYYPPDTNGDVGPNHYVQTVNDGFQIFSKTGQSLYGPVNLNTLWQGFGGQCEIENAGDPIGLYDGLADRWLLSQFTIDGPPYYQCVAVSTSPDPTGSYYRYAFPSSASLFGDYPHFGVWPDAYYMTTNEFFAENSPEGFAGAGHFAFERAAMLAGNPSARAVYFHLAPPHGGLLPSDLDGPAPPAGSPNYFVEFTDNGATDTLDIYRFHVDWTTPSSSTFTGPTSLVVAQFNSNVSSAPQPGTSLTLDTLSDRLMYRLAYRNLGDHEALVANHTVAGASNQAGVRWYELRGLSTTPTVFQQGTFAPDSDFRWMGSAAMDQAGNIGLGYSISSNTRYPSVRYTGRLVTDPPGTLPQGEGTFVDGTGSQTGTAQRWGDYSSISVDPVDDCTFWYTTEYYQNTGERNWRTRIGSFKFPNCNPTGTTPTATLPPTRTPSSTPTFCPGGVTVSGVITNTDPIQTGRVTRGSPASVCSTPRGCPGVVADSFPRHYDSYTYQNTTNRTACVTVNIINNCADNTILSAGYLGSFNPSNVCANYLGDMGVSSQNFSYAFNVPPGATYVIVLTENSASVGCTAYTLNVSPCSVGTPLPTNTATPAVTNTPTNTFTPTTTNTAVSTPCTLSFSDVHPADYFYVSVQYLACHGVISGYADGTFRPFNNTTRGQLTKIVVLAEGWTQTCTSQTFSDVPPSHTFYCYVETAVSHGVISGYADGTFKPGNDVTRGQLAKIVVLAEGWTQTCTTQHFSDVPPSHPFYCFVETAFAHGIISGYADGTFRPGNSATRGQISKIVYEAITGP
jgi:hypothetical protein